MIKYFLGGLTVFIPIFILYQIIKLTSSLVSAVFPNINLIIAFILSIITITLLGYITSKGIFGIFHSFLFKKSKKEGFLALVARVILNFKDFSEKTKKAFESPVYFEISEGVWKFGFITDDDFNLLKKEGLKNDLVAIYFPDPISFMGELLLVDKNKIKLIKEKEKIPGFLYSAGLIDDFKK